MAPKPPASLVRYLLEGRCVLFVGSGLSAWGKLPTWRELLRDIVTEMRAEEPDKPDLKELECLIEAGKLLEVADYCKEKLGPRRFSEILSDRLRGASVDIPEPHKVVVQLPFAAVVTTNYDKLLERAYGNMPRTPTHRDIAALGPLLFNDSFFILKAHGDIDRPESLVLTTRDYQASIHSNPAFNEIFSAILLTNAILFIGYSLSDPDFRLLLDRQLTTFKDYIPDRYALMSGVSSVEQNVLWRTAKIKVLSYPEGQHEEVLTFLSTLRDEIEKVQPVERPAPGPKAVELFYEAWRPDSISATTLSIRLRGQEVETVVATRSQTVSVHGRGQLPDWWALSSLLRAATGDSASQDACKVGQMLAQCLPADVLLALQKVPRDDVITLRLAAELEALPWEWLYVDNNHLFLRNPVVRAPIGVSDDARGYPLVRQPVRVLLIGDTSERIPLPSARVEIEKIAQAYIVHPDIFCRTLLGPQATFDVVAKQFLSGNYDIVHFAGHAWYDAQEAYLELHDQVLLRASEFRSLLSSRPPAILMLNSQYTAFIPPGVRIDKNGAPVPSTEHSPLVLAGWGKGGFTEVASTTGVGVFIGCVGSPSDSMAKEIGVRLHKELLKGTPVAVALHKARVHSLQKGGVDSTGLLYVMSGYPELTLKYGA